MQQNSKRRMIPAHCLRIAKTEDFTFDPNLFLSIRHIPELGPIVCFRLFVINDTKGGHNAIEISDFSPRPPNINKSRHFEDMEKQQGKTCTKASRQMH